MIEGVLMDFGGTIDSDGIHWFHIFRDAYSQVTDVPEELLRNAHVYAERTLGANPIIKPDFTFHRLLETKTALHREFLAEYGFKISVAQQIEVVDYCYNVVKQHIEEVSKPVIRELSERLKIVLVTNFYGNMHTVLREFGLESLFYDIVESAVVGVRKPDSEIYRIALSRLGVEANGVVMVGDSITKDMVPARELGCHTVWLHGRGWSDDADVHLMSVFDVTITSLAELPEVLH